MRCTGQFVGGADKPVSGNFLFQPVDLITAEGIGDLSSKVEVSAAKSDLHMPMQVCILQHRGLAIQFRR